MNSGIYLIKNLVNKKVYVGQSVYICNRLYNHLHKLRNGSHGNTYLQNSWNKYGEDNFSISTIEYCEINILNERECFWINYFDSCNPNFGYNISTPDENGYKFRHSEITLEAMREYSNEELIAFLHRYNELEGKTPTYKGLKYHKGYPESKTYVRRFGSFNNALEIAGFKTNRETVKDRDLKNNYIESIKKFVIENNRLPMKKEYKRVNGLPSYSNVIKIFGSIENMRKECDLNALLRN